MRNSLILILFAAFMVGCSDEDTSTVESFDYTVAIMSPDNTDKVAGESVHLHINFDEADDKIIHNINVVIQDVDGVELYAYTEHVHTASHYEHHDDVILDVAPGTELTMSASAWPQHAAESEETEEGHEHEEENEHGEDSSIEGKVSTLLIFTVK
jgi:hypothetical protein